MPAWLISFVLLLLAMMLFSAMLINASIDGRGTQSGRHFELIHGGPLEPQMDVHGRQLHGETCGAVWARAVN